MFLNFAFRNVLRQRARTATTLIAILSGVAGLVLASGFVKDIYIQLGEAIIHSQTGHIQLFKTGYLERGTRQPDKYLIDDPAQLSRQVLAVPGVKNAASRLSFSGVVNNGKRDLPIVGEGVEPDKEAELGTYLEIVSGRQLDAKDQYALIAGHGVAQTLGLVQGDRLTLLVSTADGALNSLEFELVGTFQSFSKEFDARAVRIPLAIAQELMLTPGANLLVVSLDRTEDTDQAYELISALPGAKTLDVRHWRNLSDFYDKTVQLYEKQLGVLEWIILFMVLLSVTNSVNMSAFERQSEFGTMRALGYRPLAIGKLLLAENAIVGFIGATVGVMLGILIAIVVSSVGIQMPPPPNANAGYVAMVRLEPWSLASAWTVGFVATFAAAIIPALRSARRTIVEALGKAI